MNIHVDVSMTRRGNAQAMLERVLREFGRAGQNRAVKVGFPRGRSAADIIAIAVYNHEGTNGGGWGGPIPPRPFITRAFFQARGELRGIMRAQARGILTSQITVEQSLMRLGIWGQGVVQDQIASNMRPVNSPVTIALKGSDRTLIDTGRLRNSVTWALEDGAGGGRGGGARGRSNDNPNNLPVYYDVAR